MRTTRAVLVLLVLVLFVLVLLALGVCGCKKERLEPNDAVPPPVDPSAQKGRLEPNDAGPPPVDPSSQAEDDEAAAAAQRKRKAVDALAAIADAGPCLGSLAEHCGGNCPTYDARWTTAARSDAAQVPCRIGGAETGECGGFRYITTGGGFGGPTEYFDSSGKLVGARVSSDFNEFCQRRSPTIEYGHVPSCRKVTKRRLCGADRPTRCVGGDPLCGRP